MDNNSTINQGPEVEHSEHGDYHAIEIVIYPFYILLLFTLSVVISLNKRKFKRRY